MDRIGPEHVFAGSGLEVAASTHTLARGVSPHTHDFTELVLVTAGGATHETTAGRHPLRRGDLLVIGPHAWHAYRRPQPLAVANVYVGRTVTDRLLPLLADQPRAVSLLWTGPRTSPDGTTRLKLDRPAAEAAASAARTTVDGPPLRRLAGLVELIAVVAPAAPPRSLHPAVRRATAIIEADLARRRTPAELARACGVTAAYLSRLFTAELGDPPSRYAEGLRLRRAAALLRETGRPVGAVAAAVGFDDQNYFARRFRAQLGTTPSAFRRAAAPTVSTIRP